MQGQAAQRLGTRPGTLYGGLLPRTMGMEARYRTIISHGLGGSNSHSTLCFSLSRSLGSDAHSELGALLCRRLARIHTRLPSWSRFGRPLRTQYLALLKTCLYPYSTARSELLVDGS